MAAIRAKNTGPELLVFKELKKKKIIFRKHYSKILGSPDIALPKNKKAIFIDGDFWHGYQFINLKKRLPNNYWLLKIEQNIKRDKRNRIKLKKEGWQVLRIWEHELKNDPQRALNKIAHFLNRKINSKRSRI